MNDASNDKQWDFSKSYIDRDEWRDQPVRHQYIHAGVEGTGLQFSFYFPPKAQYEGRFFHFMAPTQGSENASQAVHGELDRISFAIAHGGYFVESNMGGETASGEDLLKNNAAAAEYSRRVARRLYGEHRPYGYVYGGSGGSLKTCACIENTSGVWDGAVPFVIGSPMAMPSTFTIRAHAMRLLRHKLPQIIDAVDAGGSGDMYAGLNQEEKAALEEATKMGFPPQSWFACSFIGDGALPLLTPAVYASDPAYFSDFWQQPGYLGSDANGSAQRDRIRHTTRIKAVHIPDAVAPDAFTRTGVDDAWHIYQNLDRFAAPPALELEDVPQGEDLYLHGTEIVFTDGAAKGHRLPLGSLIGNRVMIGETYQQAYQQGLRQLLESLKAGDTVILDNSDYIALQTYHRHQTPAEHQAGWQQFKDAEGKPIYPQRPAIIGPGMAYHGSGGIQNGRFEGKMIVLACLMDESAFPWLADWYRGKVSEHLGDAEGEHLRLWYIENAMHNEVEYEQSKKHVVGYLGALHQALVDLSLWVEQGIAPPATTNYTQSHAQITLPASADERQGIQPVVSLLANKTHCARVAVGQSVVFEAAIAVPNKTGTVCSADWDIEGQGTFETPAALVYTNSEHTAATTKTTHTFARAGTYFALLKVTANRNSNDKFTSVRNLARVRVVVTEQ